MTKTKDSHKKNESTKPKEKKAPSGKKKGAKTKWDTSSARGNEKKIDDDDVKNEVVIIDDSNDIDGYLKYHLNEKPSEELLEKFEQNVLTARLLFYETTGFDYDNSSDININVRSSDESIKEKAINDCIKLVKNMVPSLEEKSQIRDNFIDKGGHHNILLQVCAICGINDYKMILHGELFNIDKEWYNSVLRLDDDELRKYSHSRVEGYLDITTMIYYAYLNKQSLAWAYNELYLKETAIDADFIRISKEAFNDVRNRNMYQTPNLTINTRPIVLYIVPK